MLRDRFRTFSFFQKLIDFAFATGSWYLAYSLRFYVLTSGQPGLELVFIKAGLFVGALSLYFFSRQGLYQSHRLRSRYEELIGVLKANSLACVVLVVAVYFIADERLSRSVILGYYVFSTIGFLILKLSVRNFLRYLRSKGRNLRHIVLIGSGAALEQYVQNVSAFRESGIHFQGWSDSRGLAVKYGIKSIEFSDVKNLSLGEIDGLVVSFEGEEASKVNSVLNAVYNDVVPIIVLPDLSYSYVGHSLDYHAGVPAFAVNQPNLGTLDNALKRTFDIIFSGVGLLLISPLLLLISIGVKMSSPGPVFFAQYRVGLDGTRFKMWKFRSMKVGEHNFNDGTPGWTVKDDPRKTKFGSFIRATSIDELPQLWNVFIGNMSLVGPRPEQPFYVEKFRHEIPAYMLRHKMKSGITGWAQVNGWRGDTSLHQRIECDLFYIRHWSLWFDVKILFLTFWKGFINKNAY